MTEYRVRYALRSAAGARYVHGIIYHSLREAVEAIRKIDRIGYEYIGIDTRPSGNYNSLLDGWKCSDDEPEKVEKNFGFLEIGG